MYKKYNLIILGIILIFIVSGCRKDVVKKQSLTKESESVEQTELVEDVKSIERKKQKPVNKITNIIPKEKNSNFNNSIYEDNDFEKEDMSNWKTYRNEKYGFEVGFPKKWEILKPNNLNDGFTLKSPNYQRLDKFYRGEIYLSKVKNYKNFEIIDLIKTFDGVASFWPEKFEYKKLLINGNKAIIFNEVEGSSKEVFIETGNYIFSLTYQYKIKDEYVENVFDKIVKDIKFIVVKKGD